MKKESAPLRKRGMTAVVADSALGAVDSVSGVMTAAESTFESAVAPVRVRVSKRFPSLFILATTFGVAATFLGIEERQC